MISRVPPVSLNRRLMQLAFPMIISNVTVPLLGLVDTAVVGHMDNAIYLGGVALGSMVVSLIFWLAGFLRMSTTGLAAQETGRGDTLQLNAVLLRSLMLSLIIAVLILLTQGMIWQLSSWFVEGSSGVVEQAGIYFSIRIWSAPASLANLVLFGWLIGNQRSRAVMWLVIINNSINIVLDILLVVGCNFGVSGVAIASVVAEYVTLFVAFSLVVNRHLIELFFSYSAWLNRARFSALLSLNLDILLRSMLLQICFAVMTFRATAYGYQYIAANAVLMNFLLFISYSLDGIAYAAESMVGASWGASRLRRLKAVLIVAFRWSLAFSIGFSLAFYVAGELIINLLTDLQEVRLTAQQFLPYIVMLPLCAFMAFLMDGVFVGLTWSRQMLTTMAFAVLIIFLPLVMFPVAPENHGLWLALLAMFASRGLGQVVIMKRWWDRDAG